MSPLLKVTGIMSFPDISISLDGVCFYVPELWRCYHSLQTTFLFLANSRKGWRNLIWRSTPGNKLKLR